MKAIVYHDYGKADVLRLEEIEMPLPNDNQVLIKVRAAAANPLDWHYMRGTPYIGRILGAGLRKPKDTRLGVDVAGQVVAVGRNVTQFKPGDEVFGTAGGAFAEYARASEDKVVLKPATSPSSRRRPCRWRHSPPCRACATKDGFSRARRS